MDPLELQEYVDYLSSDEGKRKWPSRFDNISTAKAKDQAKRNFRQMAAKFTLHSGMLVRAENPTVRVITTAEKLNVIRGCHDGLGGGHLGINNTIEKIRNRFWWKGYTDDVKNYVQTCERCQSGKAIIKRPSTLHPVAVPTKIFRLLGMDLVGPLNLTPRGNRYILVIIDYLTKWPEAFPIPTKEAKHVAEKLHEVICRQSVPDAIISDQGREFVNTLVDDLCIRMGTKRRISTAYHPQTNGLVERFNQSLQNALKKLVNPKQDDWDEHINTCLFAYRTAKQGSTKVSPYEMVYNAQPQLPVDLEMKADVPFELNDDEFDEYLVDRMKSFEQIEVRRSEAHQNISKAQEKQSATYNRRHCPPLYTVGQLVCLENKRKKTRKGDKLLPNFFPPVKITDVFDNGTVKVQGRKTLVNVQDIQPYFERQQETVEEGKENDKAAADENDCVEEAEIPGLLFPIEFNVVDMQWQKQRSDRVGLIPQWESYPDKGGPITTSVHQPHTVAAISPDGNCFFNSVAFVLTGSQTGHVQVRKFLHDFIKQNAKLFRGHTPNNHGTLEVHLEFISKVAKTPDDTDAWGTDLEIIAMATALNTTIMLYCKYGKQKKWLKFDPLPTYTADLPPTDKKIFMQNVGDHFTVVLSV